MDIIHVTESSATTWAQLCNELWPHHTIDEMLEAFGNGEYQHEYLSIIGDVCVAFISLSIRYDYVEGKTGSGPVGYVEGIYVKPGYRQQGIARKLVAFAKQWSAEHGCAMLASDCALSNEESRLFHSKVGFIEAGINVHFKMKLH